MTHSFKATDKLDAIDLAKQLEAQAKALGLNYAENYFAHDRDHFLEVAAKAETMDVTAQSIFVYTMQ